MADATPQPDTLPKLQAKRQKFVDLYLGAGKDDGVPPWNATAAARAAGYAKPMQEGHRLLRNADIRAHIDAALQESGISRDVALALIVDDATLDLSDIFKASRQVSQGPAESSVISSLISARTTARTNLAKAHGLFTENVNLSGGIDIQIVGVDTEGL